MEGDFELRRSGTAAEAGPECVLAKVEKYAQVLFLSSLGFVVVQCFSANLRL